MNMKEKLMRFMYGRYGVDSLGKCLLGIGIASAAATWFSDARIFPLLAWVCIIYTYFRMFSKNIYKRSAENRAYLAKTYKLRCFFARQKNMFVQRKTHHIYKCRSCKQKFGFPKEKAVLKSAVPNAAPHL